MDELAPPAELERRATAIVLAAPVEHVLATHGGPFGRDALEQALA